MKKVLVAPLDWGLGHATRCMRIIRELEKRNCDLIIASSGNALRLLQEEFPHLETFALPGYDPKYPSGGSMVLKMILQIPRFLRIIEKEHQALRQIIVSKKIDVVISDNRYGCWSPQVPSVLITHQSNIQMPKRFGWLGGFVRNLNEQQMAKFTECWIPDYQNSVLSGELSSFDEIRNVKAKFIGPLSRFRKPTTTEIEFDVLAIFSGPEPQRTILEKIVTEQIVSSDYRFVIVRGIPGPESATSSPNVYEFLTTEKLQDVIARSAVIISRSGYSTIMDLSALEKKAILIPTPGQTEQEYLAKILKEKKIAYSVSQHQFNLEYAMKESQQYRGFKDLPHSNLLSEAIDQILEINR
jgi:uncharacterized protein (TIGR00661 family)